jgi:hypothetical protein
MRRILRHINFPDDFVAIDSGRRTGLFDAGQ